MLGDRGDHACCDRCAGAGTAARIARRRLLKAAVFRPADARPADARTADARTDDARTDDARADDARARFATSGDLPRAVTGTIIDVSPHLLVISHGAGQSGSP